MRPTLQHLPHELWGIPVFGIGWVLFVMLGVGATALLLGGRPRKMALESTPFALVLALVVVFLLPNFEEAYTLVDGTEAKGIPIRGYGVMLFLGTVSAVGWAQHRAQRRGLDAEVIYSLATYVIALGLLGARAFYVIEYWQDFQQPTLGGTLKEIFKVTQGGLVVYGSLIGGALGFLIFAARHRIPALCLLDIAAPTFMLGLAIGRVGCLLNGCCYGGLCEHSWAIHFPSSSPAYAHQLANGSIRGFEWQLDESGHALVRRLIPGSPAAQAGLQVGDVIVRVNDVPLTDSPTAAGALLGATDLDKPITGLRLSLNNQSTVRIEPVEFPERTQPVHPTQIYSTINALLICLLIVAVEPFLTKTGQVTALLLAVYPVTRFLLEIIRQDEAALASTAMTISQTVSVVLVVISCGLWVFLTTRPKGLVTATSAETT